MKKTFLLPSLLALFFLASCSKENVDPKVESITPTSDLYEEGKVSGARIDAGYGAEVEVLIPATIPPGWVTVGTTGSRVRIRNLNGAPYGAEAEVLVPNTIPSGWVTVGTTGSRARIRNLNGAPYGAEVEILVPNTIPPGWVTIGSTGSRVRIRKIS